MVRDARNPRPRSHKGWALESVLIGALALVQPPVGLASDPSSEKIAPAEEPLTLQSATSAPERTTADSEASGGFWDRAKENLRLNVDVISRVETTRRRGEAAGLNALGLDMHKVFSDGSGDIGTLVVQTYLTRYDNAYPVPHYADDDDDWELVIHSFFFNLTRWGRGATNFKIGHFYIPYGLQLNTDTHMTVRQLIAHENLGADMDWGLSLNGTTRTFEYELALTQGTGHEYTCAGKNYAVAGRIGTPSDRNFSLGLSAMHGQIMDPHGLGRYQSELEMPSRVDRARGQMPGAGRGDDDLVRRTRAGIDATWIVGQFTFRGEASVGRDFNQDVFNMFLESAWTSADEKLMAYLQGIYLGQRGGFGWDEDVVARLGGVWKFANRWSVSAQYSQDLLTYGTRMEDAMFTLQLQYRF